MKQIKLNKIAVIGLATFILGTSLSAIDEGIYRCSNPETYANYIYDMKKSGDLAMITIKHKGIEKQVVKGEWKKGGIGAKL